jgi:hypothetical protein
MLDLIETQVATINSDKLSSFQNLNEIQLTSKQIFTVDDVNRKLMEQYRQKDRDIAEWES